MILFGGKKVKLFVGTQKVKAAYVGTTKVYPNSSLALSASVLNFAAAGGQAALSIQVEDGQAWSLTGVPSGWSVSATSGTGTGTVTITAPNNTTTAVAGTLTVTSEDLSAVCSLAQAAGSIVYGAWRNVRLETEGGVTSFTAAGGTAKIHMVVERDWTWNGVAGSGGTETNWSTPANVTVSDAIASVAADVLTVGSLGTTFKSTTQILIEAGSAVASSNRKTLTITQLVNAVVKVEGIGTRTTLSYSQASAAGGTSSPHWDGDTASVMDSKVRTTFASGATAGWSAATAGGEFGIDRMPYSWAGPSGNFTALDTSTGVVTVASKGTTVSGVTSGPAVTCNIYYRFINAVAYGGLTVVAESAVPGIATPTQAANAITYGSTFVLVNGSQATSAALSFGNSVQTLAVSLRQQQNCSYTSGAAGVVDTSQKPSVVSSSGYFTVADTTTYNGNATVPEYSFSITAAANSSTSTRSATVTFTFPNGDVVTVSCSQKGVSMAYQYLNVVADANSVSNGSVSQLVVAWGTSSGSYSSSKTLTGSEISTTAQHITLSQVAAGTTIYFKFTGSVTASRLGAVAFTGSNGLTLSGTTSYSAAGNVEFYGQMSVGSGGSYTGSLFINH